MPAIDKGPTRRILSVLSCPPASTPGNPNSGPAPGGPGRAGSKPARCHDPTQGQAKRNRGSTAERPITEESDLRSHGQSQPKISDFLARRKLALPEGRITMSSVAPPIHQRRSLLPLRYGPTSNQRYTQGVNCNEMLCAPRDGVCLSFHPALAVRATSRSLGCYPPDNGPLTVSHRAPTAP